MPIYGAVTGTGHLYIVPPVSTIFQLLRLEMSVTSSVPAISLLRTFDSTPQGNSLPDFTLADGAEGSGCTLWDAIPSPWHGTGFAQFDSGHGSNDVSALGITLEGNGDTGLVLVSEDSESAFWAYYSVEAS